MDELKHLIRDVPDFPTPGILFRDITPLLRDGPSLRRVVEELTLLFSDADVDVVAGVESRGFLLGTPLALALGAGFTPIRKPGKLPADTISRIYDLEYGSNQLEMHRDALRPGERVLLIDDVLATGGTAAAGMQLIEELGGTPVAAAFLIELKALGGRRKLPGVEIVSMLTY
jgi:adenine phosphoribosyltransferase